MDNECGMIGKWEFVHEKDLISTWGKKMKELIMEINLFFFVFFLGILCWNCLKETRMEIVGKRDVVFSG